HSDDREQSGCQITNPHGPIGKLSVSRKSTSECQEVDIVAHMGGHRACLAERRNRTVDDRRLELGRFYVPNAQSIGPSDLIVLYPHVRSFDKTVRKNSVVLGLKIQHDATLAVVHRLEL